MSLHAGLRQGAADGTGPRNICVRCETNNVYRLSQKQRNPDVVSCGVFVLVLSSRACKLVVGIRNVQEGGKAGPSKV